MKVFIVKQYDTGINRYGTMPGYVHDQEKDLI